ncbi:MAG: class I SAM-dependent methyltransferase [Gemmatimonadaceae bacterium]
MFFHARDAALAQVRATRGYLSDREARFLFLAAALGPASGDVLEIGSFKGRSTVALAAGVRLRGSGMVHAVDPHTAPSPTDPDLQGLASSWEAFSRSIESAGLSSHVKAHRSFSQDIAPGFTARLRVLWIDGDHTTEGARRDLRLFVPFLERGAIVAMHDVLGTWEGSLRVFCDDVLGSDDFGVAGFCGSIGWAQYRPNAGHALSYRVRRALLAFPARRLIPVAASGRGLTGWNKYRYKLWRPLALHGEVDPRTWVRRLDHA